MAQGFVTSLFSEFVARRRRLRRALGDRGQSLFELFLLGGLLVGSVGLFVKPWMAAAAPWGFALPFVFLGAYCVLEAMRQSALKKLDGAPALTENRYSKDDDDDEEESADVKARKRHDLAALALALACAGGGLATFIIAYRAEPPPVEEPVWQPPKDAIDVEILPGP